MTLDMDFVTHGKPRGRKPDRSKVPLMIRLYKKMGAVAVGRKVGLASTTVLYQLREAGIPIRRQTDRINPYCPPRKVDFPVALRLRLSGWTYSAIANKFRVSREAAFSAVKKQRAKEGKSQ